MAASLYQLLLLTVTMTINQESNILQWQ